MSIQKPSLPKGTRDFSPEEMVKRNYIFDTIKKTFRLYGFLPIETPAMEMLSTLMGKYGEEGDKLLFKILNSGPVLEKIRNEKSEIRNDHITEKGLRYDLTVPFARYVVMHQHEIKFPFKRYQIQPVWRADRPQKGRYREFYQCDADIVGSDSLLNEVELIQMIDEVFTKLGISVTIKLNNRKILSGLAEVLGVSEKIIELTSKFDNVEKNGIDNAIQDFKMEGWFESDPYKLDFIYSFLGFCNSKILNIEKIKFLKDNLNKSEIGKLGIKELELILSFAEQLNIAIDVDFTLARGLNYYTGTIIEVKANDVAMGSISGGGRYDNLTGIFGLPDVSGVGISFGADRIYDVMEELKLFPVSTTESTKLMFVNFGAVEEKYCLPLLAKVRSTGINAEIYPDHAKIKKQFDYANHKQIPFVAVIGTEEMNSNNLTLKNMASGVQEKLTIEELIQRLSK